MQIIKADGGVLCGELIRYLKEFRERVLKINVLQFVIHSLCIFESIRFNLLIHINYGATDLMAIASFILNLRETWFTSKSYLSRLIDKETWIIRFD